MLRSYAAAHGLNAAQHAVVEVSSDSITVRVGTRWARFTRSAVDGSDRVPSSFRLNENGTVTLGNGPEEEMDVAAEQIAREMLSGQ